MGWSEGQFGDKFSVVSASAIMIDNKYLSWVYGVDRKICHEGH